MKPRLEALPVTDEDRAVWLWAYWRQANAGMCGYERIVRAYRAADRRDATLMLGLARTVAMSGLSASERHVLYSGRYFESTSAPFPLAWWPSVGLT